MAAVKKYLRVGGDANNPKDYEFCRVTDRHCSRHVHIEKIPEAVKIDWSDNAAVFAAVKSGEVTLDEFNAYIEQAEANAGNKQYEDGLYLLGRLKDAGIDEINGAISKIDDPNVISRLVEDLDNMNVDHYRMGSKVNLFYNAVLVNPNTPDNIQNELLDKVDSFTMANVVKQTRDNALLTKIFNHNDSTKVYSALVSSDHVPQVIVEGALDKYPGLFAEYYDSHGWNETTATYTAKFLENPVVTLEADSYYSRPLYETDSYSDFKEYRPSKAEAILLQNADSATVKKYYPEISTEKQLINSLANPSIPFEDLKKVASGTTFRSHEVADMLKSRGEAGKEKIEALRGSSADFVPETLSDSEKRYITDNARRKNMNSWELNTYQNNFGKYFAQPDQYAKLLAATSEGKDIASPEYARAKKKLEMANRWKDILKVRSVLS